MGWAMKPDSTSSPDGEHGAASISLELRPPSEPGFAAIVHLVGEHDLATSTSFRDALQQINGNVLVDLSECSFLDSSVIGVLVRDHQARTREGQRLELLLPPQSTVARTLHISGVADLIPVRTPPP
jgi:anti-anti-sigma factor